MRRGLAKQNRNGTEEKMTPYSNLTWIEVPSDPRQLANEIWHFSQFFILKQDDAWPTSHNISCDFLTQRLTFFLNSSLLSLHSFCNNTSHQRKFKILIWKPFIKRKVSFEKSIASPGKVFVCLVREETNNKFRRSFISLTKSDGDKHKISYHIRIKYLLQLWLVIIK